MKLTDRAGEFDPRPPLPQPVLEGPADGAARMAGDGGGGLLAEYAPGAEGGWGDLSGVLREAKRVVFAGGAANHSVVH